MNGLDGHRVPPSCGGGSLSGLRYGWGTVHEMNVRSGPRGLVYHSGEVRVEEGGKRLPLRPRLHFTECVFRWVRSRRLGSAGKDWRKDWRCRVPGTSSRGGVTGVREVPGSVGHRTRREYGPRSV